MTSLQVLFGFLLLSVGYSAAEQLGKNKTFDAFAFGYFKCDGKPMPGVNVTLQVVYSDTGARLPPRTRIGREVAQSTVHRLPKHRPSGPRVEIRSLNTNSTDANGRYNLHGYNVMRGEYGVETTFRLRIVHNCYVGKLNFLPTGMVDIKDFPDKDNKSDSGLPIFVYDADLARRGIDVGELHRLD